MLVIGGMVAGQTANNFVVINQCYQLQTTPNFVWKRIADLPFPLATCAAAVHDNCVYVCGGYTLPATHTPAQNTLSFFVGNTDNSRWQPLSISNAPTFRFSHAACICDSVLLISGGRSDHTETPLSDSCYYALPLNQPRGMRAWIQISDKSSIVSRFGHSMLHIGNAVVIFGGCVSTSNTATTFTNDCCISCVPAALV